MTQDLSAVWQRFSRIKPWIAAAALLAGLVLGYWGLLTFRHWHGSGDVEALNSRIEQLSETLQQTPSDYGDTAAELEVQQEHLELVRQSFGDAKSDQLIRTLSSIAADAGVNLMSIYTGDRSSEVLSGVRYEARGATLTVGGPLERIQSFLLYVHERMAPVSALSFHLTGIDAVPVAEVNLLLYLTPEVVPGS